MGTNKERIEQLEAGLGGVQEGLHKIELGMADRLRHVEETLNRLRCLACNPGESHPRKPLPRRQ